VIYIVIGNTGEYSDRQMWIAKVFDNKKSARIYSEAMNEYFKDSEKLDWEERYALAENVEPFDENASCDYTGTWYDIEEVECLSEIPEAFFKEKK